MQDFTRAIERILAVADVYDAMALDRPYRQGMELSKVMSIIESEAGRQFDLILHIPRLATVVRNDRRHKTVDIAVFPAHAEDAAVVFDADETERRQPCLHKRCRK